MILLVANPSPVRSSMAAFLEHQRLSTKVSDSFEDALDVYLKAPHFDIIVAEYRIGNETALPLMAEIAEEGHSVPFIVFGAPLKTEAELFRRGAVASLNKGFSPRSLALQCESLRRYLVKKSYRAPLPTKKSIEDFQFGNAKVSPQRRVVELRRDGKNMHAPVSRLQLRLLQTLQSSPEQIIDYESLYHQIWRRAYRGNNAAIREAVSSLRDRLRQAGVDFDQYVTTVYGEGYRYERA
ncbi:MAG: winged helix-turn-helix domain-containing protein [Opitutaceae bacterium]